VNQRLWRNLSDEEEVRSVKGLINCQEGRDEFSNFQVGNEMRSIEDLIDCQEGSSGISYFQGGNKMRSIEDLIDCQEGRREIPDCQVGKGEERRLSESLMNSAESSYQQGELVDEDHKCILIIGGIQIFLPNSPTETSTSVAHEEVVQ
jgi:hypothetical protein